MPPQLGVLWAIYTMTFLYRLAVFGQLLPYIGNQLAVEGVDVGMDFDEIDVVILT